MYEQEIQIIENTLHHLNIISKLQNLKKKDSMVAQTVILSKSRFKSKEAAIKWIKDSDFKYSKIDETENSYRFRQKDPSAFKEGTFRTKKIDNGVSIVVAKLVSKMTYTSKFVSHMKIPVTSKFTKLPQDIKSDLDIPIPLNVELWVLSEGKNRDGTILPQYLTENVSKWGDGIEIIPFHDMGDMRDITTYNISDECGSTDNARIEIDDDGKRWIVADARITNRSVAYNMYLRNLKGKPIEISAEYRWSPSYDEYGNRLQTNIRPGAISLVNSGHIEGNKLIIKDVI